MFLTLLRLDVDGVLVLEICRQSYEDGNVLFCRDSSCWSRCSPSSIHVLVERPSQTIIVEILVISWCLQWCDNIDEAHSWNQLSWKGLNKLKLIEVSVLVNKSVFFDLSTQKVSAVFESSHQASSVERMLVAQPNQLPEIWIADINDTVAESECLGWCINQRQTTICDTLRKLLHKSQIVQHLNHWSTIQYGISCANRDECTRLEDRTGIQLVSHLFLAILMACSLLQHTQQ